MAEKLLTQCPECGAHYHITQKLLNMAGGKVRCGKCETVFKATENLMKATEKKSAPKKAPKKVKTKAKKQEVDESWAEDLLAEIGDDTKKTPKQKIQPPKRKKAAAEPAKKPAKKPILKDMDTLESPTSYTNELQQNQDANEPDANDFGEELSDSFKQLGQFDESDPFAIDPEEAATEFSNVAPKQDDWATDILQELEDSIGTDGEKTPSSAADFVDQGSGDEGFNDDIMNNVAFDGLEGSAKPGQGNSANGNNLIPELGSDLSVLSERENKGSFFKQEAKWIAASSILFVIMIAQTFILNFDALATNPSTRGLTESICSMTGCSMPLQTDISKVKLTKMKVDKQADQPNQLKISMEIKNHAGFDQPFPILELKFDDINGVPVASRGFLPSEYIQDENITFMPSNTPIQFSLKIHHPGTAAKNYAVSFKEMQ